jgi:hypothetical protein
MWILLSLPNHPRTPGKLTSQRGDLAVESEGGQEEEHIEEIFGQLWAISDQDRPRVPKPKSHDHLVWIRSDLVREG